MIKSVKFAALAILGVQKNVSNLFSLMNRGNLMEMEVNYISEATAVSAKVLLDAITCFDLSFRVSKNPEYVIAKRNANVLLNSVREIEHIIRNRYPEAMSA